MQLFGNKKKELPPLAEVAATGASYEQVVDFLVGLNKSDFDKVIKVANIYRAAEQEVAKTTGMKQEQVPPLFKTQATKPLLSPGVVDLDDDDELIAAFEGSEPDEPPIPVKKSKIKATVKNEKVN